MRVTVNTSFICRRLTWIQLDSSGCRSILHWDKRNLCQQLGLRLPVRDLRVLDPAFTSQGSGCVLVRERCIVVALEHVRIIVMKDRVLVPKGEAFSPHEGSLMRALERHAHEYSRTGTTLAHSTSQQSLSGLASAGVRSCFRLKFGSPCQEQTADAPCT